MKTCVWCQKEFQDSSVTQSRLYCSNACGKRYRRKLEKEGKLVKAQKICPGCGVSFLEKIRNSGKEYCTRKCLHQHHYRVDKGLTVEQVRSKRDIEFYLKTCQELNLTFISEVSCSEIKNGKTRKFKRIMVRCKNNHEWKTKVVVLKKLAKTGGCRACSTVSSRLAEDLVIQIAQERDFELVPGTYIAAKDKSFFTCLKCNYVWHISFTNFKRASCPGCKSSTENQVRSIFEALLTKKFPSSKPVWLKNPNSGYPLQLDGYCEELRLAFEYDGEFHYIPYWGTKSNSNLKATQKRDKFKNKLCLLNKITLVRVPYTEKSHLKQFVQKQLIELGYLDAKV